MTEIIQLTEDFRIRVETDEDAENPRSDGDFALVGALTIWKRDNYIDVLPVHEFPGDLLNAARRISENHRVWLTAAEDVIRWAKTFFGIHVHYEHGTLWWIDRDALTEGFGEHAESVLTGTYMVNGSPLTEQMLIEQEIATYRQWADGDVSYIVVEQRAIWERRDTDEPVTMTTWEEVDSIGGVYLDDNYSAAHYVSANLSIDDEHAEKALLAIVEAEKR